MDRTTPGIALEAWLDRLIVELGAEGVSAPSQAETRALLELARVAAHASERIAAPLSTYLAGLALASIPAAERADRIAALVAALEPDGSA
ncbi:MAG: DUF6457 domain-containing protein [Chloroflexi bacterium]|nr:DUF6457 domain-containing protein [Chloroflexota bacterium]MDA8238476.1 DUF6457 domain-containing protein [Chloroflexota bacterium]